MSSFITEFELPESTERNVVPRTLVKLDKCEEEFDTTEREAEFAFRTTDLSSWAASSPSYACGSNTDSDPKSVQYSELVVHFKRGNRTHIFGALPREDGVQPFREENVNYKVFEEAKYIGKCETSPHELLETAKRIPKERRYDLFSNNSWVKVFLGIFSQKLLKSLMKTTFRNESIRDINHFITNTMRVTPLKFRKLNECDEEFDTTKRNAKLAYYKTEPYVLRPSAVGEENAGSYPEDIQHWALVVHFPEGNKTYLFEAREENGLLRAYHADISLEDIQVFEKVQFFRDMKTSPKELLTKAKQVPTGNYDVLLNNWRTWLTEFLRLISPKLLTELNAKHKETRKEGILLDEQQRLGSNSNSTSLYITFGTVTIGVVCLLCLLLVCPHQVVCRELQSNRERHMFDIVGCLLRIRRKPFLGDAVAFAKLDETKSKSID